MRHHEAMNDRTQSLLDRLDAIAASLERRQDAVALIGLGSVGRDRGRLDEHSDLDFFAIVAHGHAIAFIEDLTWLEEAAPIAFAFQNTDDGQKVLFEDGIYAEFAVFDVDRLAAIPFDGARLIWQREGTSLNPLEMSASAALRERPVEWLLGELLTNLYVGLTRLRRGELLSAQRLIQGHAVDRLLELCTAIDSPSPATADRFDLARRFEQRFPQVARQLPQFVQGYTHTRESALAILDFVDHHFQVNGAIKHRILEAARVVETED